MLSSSSSCFSSHNFILKHNGDLFSFGWNGYNQMGNGSSESSIEPIKIMNNPKIKSIILGHCHSFLLEENGDLYGCGLNTNGQLGTGDIEARTKFTHITSNVRRVSTTYRFTLIQKEDRNIFFTGQGMGKYKRALTYLHINNVKSFCCGFDHSVFLTDKGEVFVMGSNECEELGLNEKYIHTPTLLMTDTNIESITCGYENTIILFRRGNKTSLKCFGRTINQTSLKYFDENEVVKSVHCGAFHTFLLTEKGEVWAVGSNSLGQLSVGSYIDQPYFIKLNLKDITHITTGYSHSIFLNKNKEILVCGHQNRLGFNSEKAVNFAEKLSFDGVYLFQNNEVMDTWCPDLHKEFPNDFKKSIFTFIMCAKMIFLHTKNIKFPIKFPKPLLHMIISFSHQMKRSYKMKPKNKITVFDTMSKLNKGITPSRPSQEFKTVNF